MGDCRHVDEHIRRPIRAPFPCLTTTPLPAETNAAARFVRDIPAGRVVRFRGARLSDLEHLLASFSLSQLKLGEATHPEISHAAGKFRTVALKQLMPQRDLGGKRLFGQFAWCFPITGPMSKKNNSEPDEPRARPTPLHRLCETASPRFIGRAAKSGRKNAQRFRLRGVALRKVEKGWLAPPSPWMRTGAPWPGNRPDSTSDCDSVRRRRIGCAHVAILCIRRLTQIARPIRRFAWSHGALLRSFRIS